MTAVKNRKYTEISEDEAPQVEGGIALTEDEQLLLSNTAVILDGIFGFTTPIQVEASIGFARYLSHVGINALNYPLFLRMLETNNLWIVDALIGAREPRLLFSSIRPNTSLIRKAFLLLSSWHPGQIYSKVLQAVLGIIENSFYSPDDGYRIYRLKIMDLNSIGKFLDESKDQFDPDNCILLSVLDRITQMGKYEESVRKSVLSKHAFEIRIAFFDNRKKCADVIPQLLLIRLDREKGEVRPSKDFAVLLDAEKRASGKG
jgi:hypothetical protein